MFANLCENKKLDEDIKGRLEVDPDIEILARREGAVITPGNVIYPVW